MSSLTASNRFRRRRGTADGIFISYRRQDEPAFAGRLYDRLVDQFGARRVFIDVDSVELGLDFAEVIDDSLTQCRVLLVVMGERWLGALNERGQPRLADPNDFVRLEVEKALAQRSVRVIPVLVEGALLPESSELPPSMESLSRRQAIQMAHVSFGSDADKLVKTVDRILKSP